MIAALSVLATSLLCTSSQELDWYPVDVLSEPGTLGYFGESVSIYGEFILVGVPNNQVGGGPPTGSAAMYNIYRTENPILDISPNDAVAGMGFGTVVSISQESFAISAPGNATVDGSVYTYAYGVGENGLGYFLSNKFAPLLDKGALFGSSISLFEGREAFDPEEQVPVTLVVGAPGAFGELGSVYVYHANNTKAPKWAEEAVITAESVPGALTFTNFGLSVSLYSDVLVIGANTETTGGIAFVFHRNYSDPDVWVYADQLLPEDASAGNKFAFSLSLFRQFVGDTELLAVVAGAPTVSSAYIFILNPVTEMWTQNVKLTGTDYSNFGYAVANYESSVIVGAPGNPSLVGTVYTYAPVNSSNTIDWDIVSELKTLMVGDLFGSSVSVYGTHLIAGAPMGATPGSAANGFAYLYEESYSAEPTPSPTELDVTSSWYLSSSYGIAGTESAFGKSSSMFGEYFFVGAPNAMVNGVRAGEVSIFNIYQEGQFANISAPTPVEAQNFGGSISIGLNNVVIGASGENGNIGAAYFYQISTVNFGTFPYITKFSGTGAGKFGTSVSIYDGSEDVGETYPSFAVIGAPASGTGKAVVYVADNALVPAWNKKQEITTTDDVTSFGQSVTIYTHTLVVGAVANTGGVAYVYNRNSEDVWILNTKLVASDGAANNGFAFSLSLYRKLVLSKEYLLLAVGAPTASKGYVFLSDVEGAVWKESLIVSNFASSSFGHSVAAYENLVAFGAPEFNNSRGLISSYRAFNNSNAVGWVVELTFFPESVQVGDQFGSSVALYGLHLVAGASAESTSRNGMAYYYIDSVSPAPTSEPTTATPTSAPTNTPVQWFAEQSFAATGVQSSFGESVSLFGEMIVIGSPNATVDGTPCGSVSIFDRYSPEQIGILTPPAPVNGQKFGRAVSVGESRLAVGSCGQSGSCSVIMYNFSDDFEGKFTFTVTAVLSPDVADNSFGSSVSLYEGSTDGGVSEDLPATVVVGAPSSKTATVYYSASVTSPWSLKTVLSTTDDVISFGDAVSIYAKEIAVGSTITTGGAVYIFVYANDNTWTFLQKLIPSDGQSSDMFGYSISLYREFLSTMTETVILAVGAPGVNKAYAWMMDPDTAVWAESAIWYGEEGSSFGTSVSAYEDLIAVGAPGMDSDNGRVYTYVTVNTTNTLQWADQFTIMPSTSGSKVGATASASRFGASVSVYYTLMLTGAPAANDNGAAYLYYESTTASPTAAPSSASGSDSADDDDGWSLKNGFDNLGILLVVLGSLVVVAVAVVIYCQAAGGSELTSPLFGDYEGRKSAAKKGMNDDDEFTANPIL